MKATDVECKTHRALPGRLCAPDMEACAERVRAAGSASKRPTCPECRRPLVSREESDAIRSFLTRKPYAGGWCYRVDFGDGLQYDPYCSRLAADLAGRADAALLALARCFPPGLLAEAAALLTERGAKTGAGPTDTVDGQTFDDHVEHAEEHMVDVALGCATDVDSGKHPIAHVVARMALAYEMAMRALGVGE